MRVLSRLFRRLFLDRLMALHAGGRLAFYGDLAALAEPFAFKAYIAPLRRAEWVVYAKRPFGGPAAILAYLARYTHRVAISNSRLVAMDEQGVSFRWKGYRTADAATGQVKIKTMRLSSDEFLRRFLLHVLPSGFHRIRPYGLLARGSRAISIDCLRALIARPDPRPASARGQRQQCGGRAPSQRPTGLSLLRRAYAHRRAVRPRPGAQGAERLPPQDRQLMSLAMTWFYRSSRRSDSSSIASQGVV